MMNEWPLQTKLKNEKSIRTKYLKQLKIWSKIVVKLTENYMKKMNIY